MRRDELPQSHRVLGSPVKEKNGSGTGMGTCGVRVSQLPGVDPTLQACTLRLVHSDITGRAAIGPPAALQSRLYKG